MTPIEDRQAIGMVLKMVRPIRPHMPAASLRGTGSESQGASSRAQAKTNGHVKKYVRGCL